MTNVSAVNSEQPRKRQRRQRKIYLPDTMWEALQKQTNWQYDLEGGSGPGFVCVSAPAALVPAWCAPSPS